MGDAGALALVMSFSHLSRLIECGQVAVPCCGAGAGQDGVQEVSRGR